MLMSAQNTITWTLTHGPTVDPEIVDMLVNGAAKTDADQFLISS